MLDSPFVLFMYKSFYIYQQDEQPIVPPLFSTGLKLSRSTCGEHADSPRLRCEVG